MKQDEFEKYLENVIKKARENIMHGSEYEKPSFQGAVMGILACDKGHTFTGKQVAEIINTVLNYKSPGNEGEDNDKNNSSNVNPK